MEKHPLQLQTTTHHHHTPFTLLTTSLPPSASLFKWKEFQIALPPSHFDNLDNIQQLFQTNEREDDNNEEDDKEGAEDEEFLSRNQTKYLNHNQLESVKRRGTLTLTNTSSKSTTFKLSPLLQKGRETAYAELLDSVALATGRILFVFIPKTFQHFKNSCKNVFSALFYLFDILIGLRSTVAKDLDKKINFERCKYLVAELKVAGKTTLHPLARYIQHQLAKCKKEKILLLNNIKPPPIPYKFNTPKGLELDFTLFDRSLFTTKITPILTKILQKTNKTDSWFLQQRELIVRSLGDDKTKEFEANQRIHEEYMRRIIDEIFNTDELRNLDRLIVEQICVWSCLRCSLDNLHNSLLPGYKQQEIKKVQNSHSLLSRDSVWLKKKEDEIEFQFYADNKFTAHEIALEELRKKSLFQGGYFVARDLYFLRETAPVLEKELANQRQPCKIYEWRVAYRDDPLFKSSTSTPLHRLIATFIYRYTATLLTLLFFSLQKIPLDSKFSFHVLYKKSHKSSTQKNHRTLRSELNSTWRRVSKERSRHAELLQKKKNLNGNMFSLKRLSRVGNMLKWYSYGVTMTIFWGVGFSGVVLFVNFGCLIVTGSCVIWPLLYSICFHLFCIVIKDLDGYHDDYKYFPLFQIVFVILFNLFKILGALLVMTIICPLGSFLVLFVTTTSYALRITYDTIMYNLLIKKHARIPLRNSFLVKKLSKSRKIYKINEKQALLILLTKLELEKLVHFHGSVLKTLHEPIEAYENFFEDFLSKFSCSLNENLTGFYRDLVRDVFSVKERLDFLVGERRNKLNSLALPRDRIKIGDFDSFCKKGVGMVTGFYSGLIQEFGLDEGTFFNGKGLDNGDYEGLFMNLVVQVFGMEVLYVGEEEEEGVDMVTRRVVNTVEQIPLPHFHTLGPDQPLRKQFSLTKTSYELHPPYLTLEAFSPLLISEQKLVAKQRGKDLLLNPLPLLHPVFVAVLILNREEDLVDLGDVAVRAVVRVMEETTPPPLLQQECISLDVSGSGSGGSSDEDSDDDEEEESEIVMSNSYLGTSV